MEDNVFQKLVKNVKVKLNKKDKSYPSMDYAFSDEELHDLSVNNKEKLIRLKENTIDSIDKMKKEQQRNLEEVLSPIEGTTKIEGTIDNLDDDLEVVEEEEKEDDNSFVRLSSKNQAIIMKEWKSIDVRDIDRDIIEGKDLLNHNYTGTYMDDALRFIHNVRKKYEVVISYLIGFNNEKKGIMGKTFFSDNKEEEWKYLNNYIKVLEKIRNNK